jgi:hypothetical protein
MMDKRIFGLFLAGLTFATAILTLSGCSDVQQHHVKVLKDYGGNVSFLDGPTWQYTGVTVTGTDYWDGRIWIDLAFSGLPAESPRSNQFISGEKCGLIGHRCRYV